MTKIVFIGAGNVELTRRILSDLFAVPELEHRLRIVLDDVDMERLASRGRSWRDQPNRIGRGLGCRKQQLVSGF